MAFYIFDCDVFGVIMASLWRLCGVFVPFMSPLCPLYVPFVPFGMCSSFHKHQSSNFAALVRLIRNYAVFAVLMRNYCGFCGINVELLWFLRY